MLQLTFPVLKITLAPVALAGLLLTTSCELPNEEAQAQSRRGAGNGAAAVETTIAKTGSLNEPLEYTGTTEPVRLVSLRSQAEGRLLKLSVDVGDAVQQGDVLGQLDDRLLTISRTQAEAELAALQSEVAQADAQVSNARTQVEQTRAELEQAQADARRVQALAAQGAATEQAAEQAQTAVRTAEQTLRSAQEQVRTQQQAVTAAERRVQAQRSAVAQEEERRQYALLVAPISGAVLERVTEPGNLIQPGEEVLTLGDFSAIKVRVQVSELELATVRSGQIAQIRLDAFPEQTFSGRVTRIAPAADPTARLVPIEITMPNLGARISSGLLARVQFQSGQAQRIVVPETALGAAGDAQDTLFVVEGKGDTAKAVARRVQLGDRANGRVEVRSGLASGEAYVVRSSAPLQDGQAIRFSILSETAQ